MKTIILDSDTIKMISLVYMQSDGFKKDVYLWENIAKIGKDKLPSFIGIFILRGTEQNFDLLKKMLKEPIFKEYHIFFTTPIDEDIIKIMADCDTHNVLKNLYEIFMDYEAVNSDFASLSIAEAY